MKGYLQRLVATVTRNERRLFPVVGSVFSDPVREQDEEAVAPGSAMEDRRAQATAPPHAETAPSTVIHGEHEQSVSPQPGKLLMPARVEAPVVAQFEKGADQAGRLANVAKESREPVDSDEPHSVTRETILPLEVREVHAIDQHADDPMVRIAAPSLREAEPASEVGNLSPSTKPQEATARLESPKTMPARRMERKESDSERGGDVQISIGRIEVVAAPSAPPRNAHATPNRFTSLSDYLKKRNGRAG